MIKTGGESVHAGAVEAVLGSHPAVAEVAVIGTRDEQFGEAVTAVVVPSAHPAAGAGAGAGAAPLSQTLAAHVGAAVEAGRLARYARPRRYVVRDRPLPRNATGKVRKLELAREVGGAGAAGDGSRQRSRL